MQSVPAERSYTDRELPEILGYISTDLYCSLLHVWPVNQRIPTTAPGGGIWAICLDGSTEALFHQKFEGRDLGWYGHPPSPVGL